MENTQNYQVDPNMNAEAYRSLTPADRPPVIDKHLQVVLVSEDQKVFLGAANMTDRYWNGTIWIYNTLDFKREIPLASTKTESGVADAVEIGHTGKYIVGEDSGIIQILELVKKQESSEQQLHCIGYACQHDDSLTSLAIFNGNSRFVSSAMDYGIRVWDITELLISHAYQPAHVDIVSSVATEPRNDNVFVSASLDGEALVWDIRELQPAKNIFTNSCGLTTVDWKPDNENILAIGGRDGSIVIIDLRNPNTPLSNELIFNYPLHKLKYHPRKTDILAACGDTNIVKIFDTRETFLLLNIDKKHKNFVRGLAWHKEELITCSWDNEILRRSLSQQE